MSPLENLLTTAEAAEIVRLSQAHLEKMRVYGRGPRFVRLGHAVRYRRADLAIWVESGIVEATAESHAGKAA